MNNFILLTLFDVEIFEFIIFIVLICFGCSLYIKKNSSKSGINSMQNRDFVNFFVRFPNFYFLFLSQFFCFLQSSKRYRVQMLQSPLSPSPSLLPPPPSRPPGANTLLLARFWSCLNLILANTLAWRLCARWIQYQLFYFVLIAKLFGKNSMAFYAAKRLSYLYLCNLKTVSKD